MAFSAISGTEAVTDLALFDRKQTAAGPVSGLPPLIFSCAIRKI